METQCCAHAHSHPNTHSHKKIQQCHYQLVKNIIDKIYEHKYIFETSRPEFLTKENGQILEFDLYNEEANLAIQVQGEHHYNVNSPVNTNIEAFEKLKANDRFRVEKCVEFGIKLLIVRTDMSDQEIENYLIYSLNK